MAGGDALLCVTSPEAGVMRCVFVAMRRIQSLCIERINPPQVGGGLTSSTHGLYNGICATVIELDDNKA